MDITRQKLILLSLLVPTIVLATRDVSKQDHMVNRRHVSNGDKLLFELARRLGVPMPLIKQVVREEMKKSGLDQKNACATFKQVSDSGEFYMIAQSTDPEFERKLAILHKIANKKQFKRSHARRSYGRLMDATKDLPDTSVTPRKGFKQKYTLQEILDEEAEWKTHNLYYV